MSFSARIASAVLTSLSLLGVSQRADGAPPYTTPPQDLYPQDGLLVSAEDVARHRDAGPAPVELARSASGQLPPAYESWNRETMSQPPAWSPGLPVPILDNVNDRVLAIRAAGDVRKVRQTLHK